MLQSEKKLKARHREKNYFKRPRSTQDLIPVDTVYPDGMFLSNGSIYSRTYRFSDINYQIAGQAEKEGIIRDMRALAKGCTPGEMSQITIINRHINRLPQRIGVRKPLSPVGTTQNRLQLSPGRKPRWNSPRFPQRSRPSPCTGPSQILALALPRHPHKCRAAIPSPNIPASRMAPRIYNLHKQPPIQSQKNLPICGPLIAACD